LGKNEVGVVLPQDGWTTYLGFTPCR